MVDPGRKKPKVNKMTKVLKELEEKYTFVTPEDIEILYVYDDGVYIQGETKIKAEVEKIVGDTTKTNFCTEVLNHFKRRSYTPRTSFNNFTGQMPVLNGLLNLETMELDDFDPTKIFTFKINTKYNKDSQCPKFLAKLKQILPKEDERKLLQEYIGYTLWPEFPHHKFMVFIGVGRNGKGVLVRTIENILGQDNVSNIRLEHLDGSHRFMVANLFGKLMNICSEPSTKRPFKTEVLKQITGQDTLDGEIKNKQTPIRFSSFAKFFIQANKLPVVDDSTLSFWERINIIEFKETFTDEKGNKVVDLESAWLDDEEERSGILNWMIAGLARLKENGKFTQTKSMSEQILKFKQASDPIGAFLSDPEECMYAPILWVTRAALYDAYKDYAENIGTKIESVGIFSERIKRLPGVGDKKKRVKGVNERIWAGVSVIEKKPTLDDFEDDPDESGAAGAAGAPSTIGNIIKKENNSIFTADIHAPSAPSAPKSELLDTGLTPKLKDLFSIIFEADTEISEYDLMKEHGYDDLNILRKLLNILARDNMIYSLRPGVWGVV